MKPFTRIQWYLAREPEAYLRGPLVPACLRVSRLQFESDNKLSFHTDLIKESYSTTPTK